MYVSYDYYRIFYYVAKLGNISQAARLLMNNQPNLTRTIKNLEGELGCALFSRTNRGMCLTPEGEALYAHIRAAIEHIEAGEAAVTERKNLQSGTVTIAASEVALRCLLLPVLKQYRMLHPGVRVRISNHSTPQAIAALKDGLADLAVITTPAEEAASLIGHDVKSFREAAICGGAFSALCGHPVTLAQLRAYPLISLGAETGTHRFYTDFFARCGLPYAPDIEAATADQILPMVQADLGVGFVPPEFIHPTDGVSVLALAEEIPARSIRLLKRRDQPLNMAARELERLIMAAEPV